MCIRDRAYDVDNYGIMAAAAQDYEAFYRSEIQVRRRLYFPPFCVMAVVGITGLDDRACLLYRSYESQKDALEARL